MAVDSGIASDDEEERHSRPSVLIDDVEVGKVTEITPLLPRERLSGRVENTRYQDYRPPNKGFLHRLTNQLSQFKHDTENAFETIVHPRRWDVREALNSGVGMLSAVFLGVLLNILDGLSYGIILFPLGEEIFEKTGPDGISMFYVSCIISQLTYSLGGSRFKGGVGSEMIEVVPFFHKMAYMVFYQIGDTDPAAVIPTVNTAYALSSVLTGIIFLLLSVFKLGDLVSFFPRSILLGCIGGVGVFLVLTGLEVSAGLDSNMDWNLDTLEALLAPATLVLWLLPLALSVLLLGIRKFLTHPVVIPGFFILVTLIFYIVFWALPNVSMSDLQAHGWVFAAPESGVPFYHFYSYYGKRYPSFSMKTALIIFRF